MSDPIHVHFNLGASGIPLRQFDYVAYRDPERYAGYGRTAAEALIDFQRWELETDCFQDCRDEGEGAPYPPQICQFAPRCLLLLLNRDEADWLNMVDGGRR